MENTDKIVENLKSQISDFETKVSMEKTGAVVEVGDGIAKISGLSEVMASEMLDFGNDVFGVALNLEEDLVGAILLNDINKVKKYLDNAIYQGCFPCARASGNNHHFAGNSFP